MLKKLLVLAFAASQALARADPPPTTTTTAVTSTSAAPGRCGPAKCSDACARDLTQCVEGPEAVNSHCSAFLKDIVVTASTPTSWVTSAVATEVITITTSSMAPVKRAARALAKRVTVTSIANWAPDCLNDEQFSSACSCFGVTATTSTETPPAVTSTVSITATITATSTHFSTI